MAGKVFDLDVAGKIVRLQDDSQTDAEALFEAFKQAIDVVEQTRGVWHPRCAPLLSRAIDVLRAFVDGKAGTPDVKAQFAAIGQVGGSEVLMDDTQTYAALAVVEVAHAAAHMGHYVMHKSRIGTANQEYATTHKSYVKMGLQLALRYYRKAMGLSREEAAAA